MPRVRSRKTSQTQEPAIFAVDGFLLEAYRSVHDLPTITVPPIKKRRRDTSEKTLASRNSNSDEIKPKNETGLGPLSKVAADIIASSNPESNSRHLFNKPREKYGRGSNARAVITAQSSQQNREGSHDGDISESPPSPSGRKSCQHEDCKSSLPSSPAARNSSHARGKSSPLGESHSSLSSSSSSSPSLRPVKIPKSSPNAFEQMLPKHSTLASSPAEGGQLAEQNPSSTNFRDVVTSGMERTATASHTDAANQRRPRQSPPHGHDYEQILGNASEHLTVSANVVPASSRDDGRINTSPLCRVCLMSTCQERLRCCSQCGVHVHEYCLNPPEVLLVKNATITTVGQENDPYPVFAGKEERFSEVSTGENGGGKQQHWERFFQSKSINKKIYKPRAHLQMTHLKQAVSSSTLYDSRESRDITVESSGRPSVAVDVGKVRRSSRLGLATRIPIPSTSSTPCSVDNSPESISVKENDIKSEQRRSEEVLDKPRPTVPSESFKSARAWTCPRCTASRVDVPVKRYLQRVMTSALDSLADICSMEFADSAVRMAELSATQALILSRDICTQQRAMARVDGTDGGHDPAHPFAPLTNISPPLSNDSLQAIFSSQPQTQVFSSCKDMKSGSAQLASNSARELKVGVSSCEQTGAMVAPCRKDISAAAHDDTDSLASKHYLHVSTGGKHTLPVIGSNKSSKPSEGEMNMCIGKSSNGSSHQQNAMVADSLVTMQQSQDRGLQSTMEEEQVQKRIPTVQHLLNQASKGQDVSNGGSNINGVIDVNARGSSIDCIDELPRMKTLAGHHSCDLTHERHGSTKHSKGHSIPQPPSLVGEQLFAAVGSLTSSWKTARHDKAGIVSAIFPMNSNDQYLKSATALNKPLAHGANPIQNSDSCGPCKAVEVLNGVSTSSTTVHSAAQDPRHATSEGKVSRFLAPTAHQSAVNSARSIQKLDSAFTIPSTPNESTLDEKVTSDPKHHTRNVISYQNLVGDKMTLQGAQDGQPSTPVLGRSKSLLKPWVSKPSHRDAIGAHAPDSGKEPVPSHSTSLEPRKVPIGYSCGGYSEFLVTQAETSFSTLPNHRSNAPRLDNLCSASVADVLQAGNQNHAMTQGSRQELGLGYSSTKKKVAVCRQGSIGISHVFSGENTTLHCAPENGTQVCAQPPVSNLNHCVIASDNYVCGGTFSATNKSGAHTCDGNVQEMYGRTQQSALNNGGNFCQSSSLSLPTEEPRNAMTGPSLPLESVRVEPSIPTSIANVTKQQAQKEHQSRVSSVHGDFIQPCRKQSLPSLSAHCPRAPQAKQYSRTPPSPHTTHAQQQENQIPQAPHTSKNIHEIAGGESRMNTSKLYCEMHQDVRPIVPANVHPIQHVTCSYLDTAGHGKKDALLTQSSAAMATTEGTELNCPSVCGNQLGPSRITKQTFIPGDGTKQHRSAPMETLSSNAVSNIYGSQVLGISDGSIDNNTRLSSLTGDQRRVQVHYRFDSPVSPRLGVSALNALAETKNSLRLANAELHNHHESSKARHDVAGCSTIPGDNVRPMIAEDLSAAENKVSAVSTTAHRPETMHVHNGRKALEHRLLTPVPGLLQTRHQSEQAKIEGRNFRSMHVADVEPGSVVECLSQQQRNYQGTHSQNSDKNFGFSSANNWGLNADDQAYSSRQRLPQQTQGQTTTGANNNLVPQLRSQAHTQKPSQQWLETVDRPRSSPGLQPQVGLRLQEQPEIDVNYPAHGMQQSQLRVRDWDSACVSAPESIHGSTRAHINAIDHEAKSQDMLHARPTIRDQLHAYPVNKHNGSARRQAHSRGHGQYTGRPLLSVSDGSRNTRHSLAHVEVPPPIRGQCLATGTGTSPNCDSRLMTSHAADNISDIALSHAPHQSEVSVQGYAHGMNSNENRIAPHRPTHTQSIAYSQRRVQPRSINFPQTQSLPSRHAQVDVLQRQGSQTCTEIQSQRQMIYQAPEQSNALVQVANLSPAAYHLPKSSALSLAQPAAASWCPARKQNEQLFVQPQPQYGGSTNMSREMPSSGPTAARSRMHGRVMPPNNYPPTEDANGTHINNSSYSNDTGNRFAQVQVTEFGPSAIETGSNTFALNEKYAHKRTQHGAFRPALASHAPRAVARMSLHYRNSESQSIPFADGHIFQSQNRRVVENLATNQYMLYDAYHDVGAQNVAQGARCNAEFSDPRYEFVRGQDYPAPVSGECSSMQPLNYRSADIENAQLQMTHPQTAVGRDVAMFRDAAVSGKHLQAIPTQGVYQSVDPSSQVCNQSSMPATRQSCSSQGTQPACTDPMDRFMPNCTPAPRNDLQTFRPAATVASMEPSKPAHLTRNDIAVRPGMVGRLERGIGRLGTELPSVATLLHPSHNSGQYGQNNN